MPVGFDWAAILLDGSGLHRVVNRTLLSAWQTIGETASKSPKAKAQLNLTGHGGWSEIVPKGPEKG